MLNKALSVRVINIFQYSYRYINPHGQTNSKMRLKNRSHTHNSYKIEKSYKLKFLNDYFSYLYARKSFLIEV